MDINDFTTWDGGAKHACYLTMLFGIGNIVLGLNDRERFEAGLILAITGYFFNRIRKEVKKMKFPAPPAQMKKSDHSRKRDQRPPNSDNPEL